MYPLPSYLYAIPSLHRIQGELYTKFKFDQNFCPEALRGLSLDRMANLNYGLQSLTYFTSPDLISY